MGWADETTIAGIVFHNWQPEAGVIELSAYSTGRAWLTKARVREVFDYAFGQLGNRMVVVRRSERNRRARRIWAALGATEYVIPRLLGDDEAECIRTLHRDDWQRGKFVRDENG